MNKETIKRYLEQVLKWTLIWLWLSLWISLGIVWIYAFNWSGVSSVSSSTPLTANMWNTTMSTITWAIQTLETWNITIWWTKTFSSPVVWQTPTANNHLATKWYVDWITSSIPTWAIMAFYLWSCPTGWIPADWTSSTPDLRWAFVRWMWWSLNGRDVARTLWDYQLDELKSHTHTFNAYSTFASGIWYSKAWSSPDIPDTYSTNSYWWTETRPKNVALLYCMKQ